MLQSSDFLAGPWADQTGGTAAGGGDFEAHLPVIGSQRFFRLRRTAPCPDSSAAVELVRTNRVLLGDLEDPPTPEPTLTWFDPGDALGKSGPAQPAWSFPLGGDRPADVIVSATGTQVLDVVLKGPETPFTHLTTPRYLLDRVTGVPRFVSFNPPLVLPAAATANAVSIANEFFRTFPWMFGTGNPAQQLQLVRVDPDLDGGKHVVFQQLYAGMLVWGCELRVHLNNRWAITSITGRYYRDPDVELAPSISELDAFSAATQHWIQANGDVQLGQGETIETRGLVVLPTRLAGSSNQNDITWWFRFPDADRFVSASTGTNVTAFSRWHYLNDRKVYDLNNQYAGSPELAELQLSNSVKITSNPLDPEADSVDSAIAIIQSFWLGNAFRNSWDGEGGNMVAMVDASFDKPSTPETEPPTSGWNGFYTAFSRDFAAQGSVAHEFTHALTQASANLVYAFQPGALNESFSDVFAKLIFPNPTPWVIGANLPPTHMRDLEHPVIDNYAKFVIQANTREGGYGGVHTNSGIGSRAAVLISDGDRITHHGIGRPKLARIWWDTLTTRLSPWSTYVDLLAAAAEVTQGLAGVATGFPRVQDPNDVPGFSLPPLPFTRADLLEVLWAFRQVGLDLQLQSGWFSVPANATTTFVGFPGKFTECPGQTVSDVIVRLNHRPQPGVYGSALTKDGTVS
jgi:Zn-dependent metalloprotease